MGLWSEFETERPWGCGLSLKDPKVSDRKSWKEQGIMGMTLERIRAELMEEYNMPRGVPARRPPPLGLFGGPMPFASLPPRSTEIPPAPPAQPSIGVPDPDSTAQKEVHVSGGETSQVMQNKSIKED